MKDGSLSLCVEEGSLYLRIDSFRRTLVISEAFSVLVGYAFTHREKESPSTGKYLKFPVVWDI